MKTLRNEFYVTLLIFVYSPQICIILLQIPRGIKVRWIYKIKYLQSLSFNLYKARINEICIYLFIVFTKNIYTFYIIIL